MLMIYEYSLQIAIQGLIVRTYATGCYFARAGSED